MMVPVLQAKIHRATVTDADLAYEGSITIDPALLDLAGLKRFQMVQVYNVTNGHRFETYVMLGRPGAGEIVINGAAAHLASPGDKVIIAAYVHVDAADVDDWTPALVFVDDDNRPKPHPEA